MKPNAHLIKIIALFHISTDPPYTYFVCEVEPGSVVKFPSSWKLFCDDDYLLDIVLAGLVMDNSKGITHTFCTEGHIDKSVFDFTRNMEFRSMD